MFNLFRRSGTRHPRIRQALIEAGLSAAGDPARITVLETHGNYAGRRVRYFRAFEPGRPDLVLASGHVEHDGVVVVNGRPEPDGTAPARAPADRASHADDERLVFTGPAGDL